MNIKLGIGIITHDRGGTLARTLKAIEDLTKTQCIVCVADDGSTDGTATFVRTIGYPCITGENMGVARNKNRALFYLFAVRQCSHAILLEDDAVPTEPGWESDWIDATQRYGHVNLAGQWFPFDSVTGGTGTPDDPIISTVVSGQVEAFSAASIAWGGYLDPRFRGYGYGHVEHTRRLIRLGFGGTNDPLQYYLLKSLFMVTHQRPTLLREDDKLRNEALCKQLLGDTTYRMPWRDEADQIAFRAEIEAAIAAQ